MKIDAEQTKIEIPTYKLGTFLIRGEYANGQFYVPFSVTEIPLIPSVNRGRKITYISGGIRTEILKDEMTRGPLLKTTSPKDAREIADYINAKFDDLRKIADSTSGFGKLQTLETKILDSDVYFRLGMFCGDAAGHNMTTKAAEAICLYLMNLFHSIEYYVISGNYCTDKKPAQINIDKGRGKTVKATAVIPKTVIEEYLHTSAERIIEINHKKNIRGSQLAGSLGKNGHHANIIAAIYLATGQDIANVVEGSLGETIAYLKENVLEFSVLIPALIVGTVGGGTNLPYAQENLKLMECNGSGKIAGNNSKKLAEIIAASVLCGEISLLGALSNNGELMKAHEAYERISIRGK